MHVRRVIAAGLTPPLLALAGCASEPTAPAPDVTSEAETASESTAGPSPSASTTPGPVTAEAFVRSWVLVKNQMVQSGDTEEFLDLATQDCSFCHDFSHTISDIYKDGGIVRTKGWRIVTLDQRNKDDAKFPEFFITVDSAPTRYRESANGPWQSLAGGKNREHRIVLVHRGNSFRIASVEQVVR